MDEELLNQFSISISCKNYSLALEIYEQIFNNPSLAVKYQYEKNLYLFLLSYLTNLPKEYTDKLNKLKIEDITLNYEDEYHKFIRMHNKIGQAIINKKFSLANDLYNTLYTKKGYLSFNDMLMKQLLEKVKIIMRYQNEITRYIKNYDFNNLFCYVNNICMTENLNKIFTYILKLSLVIKNMITKNELPAAIIIDSQDIYEQIEYNNFGQALSLALKKRNDKQDESWDLQIIIVLLKIINKFKIKYQIKQDIIEESKRCL